MMRALLDRIGWDPYLKPFLYKKLPPGTGWSATLGSLCVMLFLLLTVTGIFLAMFYNPSPDKAYQSIDYIMQDVPLGSLLRGLHHWGAGAMVLVVFLHLLSSFFSGSYKAPREITWLTGACLFVVTLGLGFTGYLLPWDMKAYWATVVVSNIPKSIPVIGDFITRAMLGGDGVSGYTLTRFYSIHMLLLPALLVFFTAFHIYLVRIHGLMDKKAGKDVSAPNSDEQPYRFYPEHSYRSLAVFALLMIGLTGLSLFGKIPKEEIAGTLLDTYLPRPEWYYMWTFQLLTYFSGQWEEIVTFAIFVVGGSLLVVVPFLGSKRITGLANRPLCMAAGVTLVLGLVYLSYAAYAGLKPYKDIIPVPDRQLSASEQRGLKVYVEKECTYCHQIKGRGGLRTGPDLANMVAKNKKPDYLAKFVKNPQSVAASSSMPKYALSDRDLSDLADFMLALDFNRHSMKIVSQESVIKGNYARKDIDN